MTIAPVAFHHAECFCGWCRGDSGRARPCECKACANQLDLGEQTMPMPKPGSGKLPAPQTVNTPFLKVSDLKKKGPNSLKLTGRVRTGLHSEFGEQIAVDVIFNGDPYTLAVKLASGNYARLFSRFGDEEKNWRGTVTVEVKKHLGKDYIAVI